ncbi:Hypothetical protein IALB_2145 [Ignavibacterium album JCM 16511]|uniref:Uncharacterized protein n=1 Tax=Ignavibacterium album (strain DSM 19864 / JCM 16511 / NBRC 101810 / Mat9-16) TaxID=945713 RepID=I0ALJ3_IGNAJ|nr:hypothetical protein [Ignavibacterium album]AFH49850.1 Hypothetical protein IALB_2145 [Ignavibacterium album JCM 16511]
MSNVESILNWFLKNFKTNLTIILILISTYEISAQSVIVNLQSPPPYQMKIEDMWNLVIINRDKERQVYLQGTAIELNSGLIVDVSTSVFTIPLGSKRIRAGDVGTITINEKNSNYQSVINRLSALPNGSYEICVEVIDANANSVLGVSCVTQDVLNLSQVTLMYPEDQAILMNYDNEDDSTEMNQSGNDSTINTGQNLRGIEKKDIRRGMVIAKPGSITPHNRLANSSMVFSWLPPTPVPQNTIISYRIKIVEMYENQSPYDAMQSNPFFFSASGIFSTSFVYPVAAREFNPERTYAWQVEAYSDGALLASSEIYTFAFKPNNQRQRSLNDAKRSSLNIIRASNTIIDNLPEGLRSSSLNILTNNSLSFRNGNLLGTNNLFSIPNLLGSLLSNSETKAVSFAFEGELSGETASRKGSGSDRKPSYGYVRLTPSVSLYGIPFGLNLLLSSENSSGRQNINSASFFYSVDAAKEVIENKIEEEGEENVPGLMKFFSYFNSFGIGTNYPSYTPFTMQGAPVSGLSFEFNPGWFYLATALQQNQKPIDNVSFRRDLYAGRIGVGKKDDSHLFFTGIYSKDKSGSIVVDSSNRLLTPNTNYVFGIDSRLNLFEDKLSLEGEISGAMLTRDNRDPDLVNEDIPQFVRNIFQPKVSSQVDYAYSLKSIFNNSESNTKISAGVKMIGPGYKTHGNPALRNDRFEVEGKVEQKFVQRQISVAASMKYYRDNLINSKLFTTTTLAPGLQLGLRFKNYPSLTLGYNPNFLSNDANDPSKKIDFKNHLFTAATGYNFKLSSDMNLASNLFYMFNKSKSLDSLSGYTLNSFSLSENLSFKSPLVIGAAFGMNFMDFAGISSTITNLDGNVGYTFFEQWNNVFGISYSIEKDRSNRVGFYLNSSYNFSESISADLRVEKNNYSDKILSTNDYNEILARTTIRIKL